MALRLPHRLLTNPKYPKDDGSNYDANAPLEAHTTRIKPIATGNGQITMPDDIIKESCCKSTRKSSDDSSVAHLMILTQSPQVSLSRMHLSGGRGKDAGSSHQMTVISKALTIIPTIACFGKGEEKRLRPQISQELRCSLFLTS
jgi:hypothetical protein